MEKIKMMLQQFKEKCQTVKSTVKRKWWEMVLKFEAKHGFAKRCAFCEDRIFCEIGEATPKKSIFEVRRCTDHHSTR